MDVTPIERRPLVKRFPMPAGSPVKTVTIRELFGSDEMEAAAMVDALNDPTLANARAAIQAEKREGIRRSIVALGDVEVDPAVPVFQIDTWGRVPIKALERFFGDVNGLRTADITASRKDGKWSWDANGKRWCQFKLPPRCSLESVTIWEIGGNEEIAAAIACDKMGEAGPAVTALRHRRELIRGALGEAGKGLDFGELNMRTSMALSLLFDTVNGIPEDEIEGCVAAAVDMSGAAPAEIGEPPAQEGAPATG